jgi:hypothetical protein
VQKNSKLAPAIFFIFMYSYAEMSFWDQKQLKKLLSRVDPIWVSKDLEFDAGSKNVNFP